MLDTQKPHAVDVQITGAPLDFQAHLAALEARGLLLRIERAIEPVLGRLLGFRMMITVERVDG